MYLRGQENDTLCCTNGGFVDRGNNSFTSFNFKAMWFVHKTDEYFKNETKNHTNEILKEFSNKNMVGRMKIIKFIQNSFTKIFYFYKNSSLAFINVSVV